MLKLLSLFTGIGAFEKALERLNIDYELVGFSEIDKFAIKSYCAIHNVTEDKNLGDVSKININNIPYFDIMTWGFPCQDISIAGRMAGIKEGTRSGLYYEGYKILKEKKPKYSIIENVKNLTSKRFESEFTSILKDIEQLGYNNYWKVLNAKDFGIPQNRERVFIVSIRKDIDNKKFKFPEPIPLNLKLKDILYDKVEEKYYLSDKAIESLIRKNNRLIREKEKPKISKCIVAGYYKLDPRDSQYIADKVKVNKPYILVNEGTKKGYTKAYEGDSINYSYPKSITKRGRVGRKISQTILTSSNIATIVNVNKPICLNNSFKQPSVQDRIYDEEGIATAVTASQFRPNIAERKMFNPYNQKEVTDTAPTQTTNCGTATSSAAVLISEDGEHFMKIRKLTPLECWRLMGFDDDDLYKAKMAGISDTQLYRQAGNSIVVNVLEKIFERLFTK